MAMNTNPGFFVSIRVNSRFRFLWFARPPKRDPSSSCQKENPMNHEWTRIDANGE